MVSALCVACGLCCEGSLFLYLRLSEAEAAQMAARGAQVFRRKRLTAMRLGCPMLEGARCTMYETRPSGCRAYYCELALEVRDGRVGLDEALQRVREARALIVPVEAGLPPPVEGERENPLQRARQCGLLCGPDPLRRADAFLAEHFTGISG